MATSKSFENFKNCILILMVCSTQVEKLFHICFYLELIYIIISAYDYAVTKYLPSFGLRDPLLIAKKWFILLLIILLITAIYPCAYSSFDTFFKWARNIILFYFVIKDTMYKPYILRLIVGAYCLTSVICGLLIINGIGLDLSDDAEDFGEVRLSFLGMNSNKVALTFTYSFMIAIYGVDECLKFFQNYKKFFFIGFFLVIMILFLYCLSLLASRGSVMMVFLGIVYYFGIYKRNSSIGMKLIFYCMGAALIVFAYNYLMSSDIMAERVSASVDEGNYGARDKLMYNAIEMFLESPVYGVGMNEVCYRNYLYFGNYLTTHNYFTFMLSSGGLIGAIGFVEIIYRIAKNTIWHSYKRQFLLGALLFIVAFVDFMKNGACVVYVGNYIFFAIAYSYTKNRLKSCNLK